jgi:membrane protease YdiL (CAAX protease family)
VAVATALFALLHAPNLPLMAGVTLAGAFWTAHFLAHRNLLAVVLSHLLLGSAAMASLGPGPLGNLRVGPGALALLVR